MYLLQECENKYEKVWFDKVTNFDYKYICDLARLYSEKFPDKIFRIVEVYIYV